MEIRSGVIYLSPQEQEDLSGYPSRILLSGLGHLMEVNEGHFDKARALTESANSVSFGRKRTKFVNNIFNVCEKREEFFRQVVELAVEQEFAGFDEEFGIYDPEEQSVVIR